MSKYLRYMIMAVCIFMTSTVSATVTTVAIGDLANYSVGGYNMTSRVKGTFDTDYTFSLNENDDVTFYLDNVQRITTGHIAYLLNIPDLMLYFSTPCAGIICSPFTYNGSGKDFNSVLLRPGSYSFSVTGTTTGTQGGMYKLNAAAMPDTSTPLSSTPLLSTTTIPEPPTLSLVLAGFGIFGFLTYRLRMREEFDDLARVTA